MLKNLVTIVVPCKNEEDYIGHLLYNLSQQIGIDGVRIIIADKSDDNTRVWIHHYGIEYELNYEVVEGGPVSEAKNNGAKLVTTPYVLFIDSDVRFFTNRVIFDTVMQLQDENLDLIGLKMKCYDNDMRTQIGFMMFNIINSVMSNFIPFAVGAYMLTRTDKFWELGGFPAKYATSEDFFLSKMYDVKKFKIAKHYFGQDSRRFRKMGYLGMSWYLIKNFLNRNNEKHWKKIDASGYWD